MPRRLDLGCGVHCAPGYEGVDISPCHIDVKHVVDLLDFPWPWADGSVEEIRCVHFLEHLPAGFWTPRRAPARGGVGVDEKRGAATASTVGDLSPFQRDHRSVDLLMKFMAECWRVLAPGGKLLVEVPQAHNHRAYQDPTHRRFFVGETFFYFSREWRRQMGLDHGAYGVECDFSFEIEHTFSPDVPKEIEILLRTQQGRRIVQDRDRERWNVTEDLRVHLVKIAAPAAETILMTAPATARSEDELDRRIAEANARAAEQERVEAEARAAIDARARDVARTDHEVVTDEEPHLFRVARAPGGMIVFQGNMVFPGDGPKAPEVRAFPDPTPEEKAVPMPSMEGRS